MKGIVYTDFGEPEKVLKVMDLEKPVPADDEVLIKVRASSINISDYKRFTEPVFGKEIPESTRQLDMNVLHALHQVLGADVSGIVEAVGKNVKTLKIGEEVFGMTSNMLGAWAEYVCVKENEVCLKPKNLNFFQSATLPIACSVALGAVRLANVQENQHILINGASGGVGVFTLQLAKAFGATVTAVCSSRNVDMVHSCGADYIIDYTKEDFTENGIQYDCILAINGYHTLEEYKNSLKDGGIYIPVGGSQQCAEASQNGQKMFLDSGKRLELMTIFTIKRELPVIKQMAENEQIVPVIDDIYSINNVATAIERIIRNHAQGKTVVDIDF